MSVTARGGAEVSGPGTDGGMRGLIPRERGNPSASVRENTEVEEAKGDEWRWGKEVKKVKRVCQGEQEGGIQA